MALGRDQFAERSLHPSDYKVQPEPLHANSMRVRGVVGGFTALRGNCHTISSTLQVYDLLCPDTCTRGTAPAQSRANVPISASLPTPGPRPDPTSPQAVTGWPFVTGQLICKYSSYQFWGQQSNMFFLYGGWAFHSAFNIHNSQRAGETDTHAGERLFGATSWEPRPHPSPAQVCLVGSDPHLLSWPALWDWGPPGGSGIPRPALRPPAGLAPEPSPACLPHLLHKTPPASLASWNPRLGLCCTCWVFLLPPGLISPTAQHPDTSRSAAERGFIQEAAEQRGKTHLKPASLEARGWSVPEMKTQGEGWSRLME